MRRLGTQRRKKDEDPETKFYAILGLYRGSHMPRHRVRPEDLIQGYSRAQAELKRRQLLQKPPDSEDYDLVLQEQPKPRKLHHASGPPKHDAYKGRGR
jgi:hypothetical protein